MEREPVDLVALDLHMPGLAGEEVIRHIKAKYPKTKVVVVTGYPERVPGARALGCDALLTKPFSMNELTRIVETLLVQKDEGELRDSLLGHKAVGANPGEPVAQLLFLEPNPVLSEVLAEFFGIAAKAGGRYQVYMADNVERAVALMRGVHPDIVLLGLMGLKYPEEVTKTLRACEFQPKDYIFYLRSHLPEDEAFLAPLPVKRWDGNPLEEAGLRELAELVHKTAVEHALVKR